MKKKYRYIVVFLVLIANVVVIYALRNQKANNMAGPIDDQSVSVSTLLGELGDRYGYFFTLEESWKDGGVMNRIEGQRLQRPSKGRDIWKDLGGLSRLVPGVRYKVDEANPKIIHIIDAGLAQQKGYALDTVIPRIDFSGTVFDLVKELEKRGIRVSSSGTVEIHELSMMDFKTQVHVQGEKLSVRRALSAFIPLTDRTNRILWVARTKMGPKAVSFVRFPLGSLPAKAPAD